jgi:hypothetical protein
VVGVTLEEATLPPFDVWPDCWEAVCVFASVPNGAWTVGQGGAVGIRPECYPELRLVCDITPDKWRELYADFQVMELAALKYMHKDDKK